MHRIQVTVCLCARVCESVRERERERDMQQLEHLSEMLRHQNVNVTRALPSMREDESCIFSELLKSYTSQVKHC